ncbi:MAG: phospholipase D-like domain-containing protein [Paracoccus sp. (in: a-proteobacteria)]|uniref:phospholipase D-like domain-containing protein n=1 Tax=Paracoccus sp. TaxID=267 RepID=UPI00391C7200
MDPTDDRLARSGQNCWRIEKTRHFTLIRDADDYFRAVRQAMSQARRSILLIGWDFDARIELGVPGDEGGPARLGDFVLWLARKNPELQIRLLRWDTGAIKSWFRGTTLLTILRWKLHPRITLRLDGKHPLASSHHHKIVVIDDCLAFCGGIDMTVGRWDTPEHLDDDPRRTDPSGRPVMPWHDATTAFDGPAARALGDLARDRWRTATGQQLPPVTDIRDCWPEQLTPTFRDVTLAIARTRPAMPGTEPIHEVEQLYLDLIARARRFIYAESQYFASRRIAQAIARRLTEPDPPEIVIVNPVSAQGWLEPLAMDTARARLVEALRRLDHKDRFRMYHPVTAGGTDIYVHAKVMIVDDTWLRVGSSNFNNRSMRLDSECDVLLSADRADAAPDRDRIAALRAALLAEHLGLDPDDTAPHMAEKGGLIDMIESARGPRGSGRTLVPYELPELNGFEEWLAENEIMDPEGPDKIFEPLSRRSLFRGWSRRWRRMAGIDGRKRAD